MKSKRDLLSDHIDALENSNVKSIDLQYLQQWIDEARVLLVHGTRGHYVQGCRHPLCRKAEAQYQKNRRAAIPQDDIRESLQFIVDSGGVLSK